MQICLFLLLGGSSQVQCIVVAIAVFREESLPSNHVRVEAGIIGRVLDLVKSQLCGEPNRQSHGQWVVLAASNDCWEGLVHTFQNLREAGGLDFTDADQYQVKHGCQIGLVHDTVRSPRAYGDVLD